MWQLEEMYSEDCNWNAFFRMPGKSSGFYFFHEFLPGTWELFCTPLSQYNATHSLTEVGMNIFAITHVTWWTSTPMFILFDIWCHGCHSVFALLESGWIKIITHSLYLKTKLNTPWKHSSLVQVLSSWWPHLHNPTSFLRVVTDEQQWK